MRNPERIPEIMALLQKGWEKVPDWRFGQVIENFKRYIGKEDIFYLEDEEIIRNLIDYFDLEEEGK